MKSSKIILIGAGAVGTSFLYSAMNQGLASKYGIMDAFEGPRDGNVLDLQDVISPSVKKYEVFAANYADAKDADFVVICAGRPQKPGETRLEMVADNVKIMRDIARQIKDSGFKGITIIASNPVDVLAQAYIEETGFPVSKVIGSGTALDTSRLRYEIATRVGVSTKDVQAFVLGEHGDSSVVNYSSITVAGVPFSKFEKRTGINKNNYETELEHYVARKAYEIINRKRATFYGIGACLSEIVRAIQEDSKAVLAVGAYLKKDYYGVKDVVIGVPAIIGAKGIEEVLKINLNAKEQEKFQKSAEVIKSVVAQAM